MNPGNLAVVVDSNVAVVGNFERLSLLHVHKRIHHSHWFLVFYLRVRLDVSLARTAGRERLATPLVSATERLFTSVGPDVLLECAFLVPFLSTALERALKRFLTSVNSSVNLKVGRAKEGFSTAREHTSVWFGTLVVSSKVVHKVSFGSEFPSTSFQRASKRGCSTNSICEKIQSVGRVALIHWSYRGTNRSSSEKMKYTS